MQKARGAQGIEAEILLVCQKIGAESPFFCGEAAKNAPKSPFFNFSLLPSHFSLSD
jgi:hypothetical protein